jgi:hypothetical protein
MVQIKFLQKLSKFLKNFIMTLYRHFFGYCRQNRIINCFFFGG